MKKRFEGAGIFFVGFATVAVVGFVILFAQSGGNVPTFGIAQNRSGLLADIGSAVPGDDTTTDTPAAAPAAVPVTTPAAATSSSSTTAAVTTTTTPAPSVESTAQAPSKPTSPSLTETTEASATTPPPTPAPTPAVASVPTSSSPTLPSSTASTAQQTSTPTLPYAEANFAGDESWAATAGATSIDESGFLEMATANGGDAVSVHLNNSANWGDYTFTANLNWVAGGRFDLTARYHDDGDLVFCEYDEKHPGDFIMSLEQNLQGNEVVLAQSDDIALSDAVARPNITASIRVSGPYGWCSLNGHEISNSPADSPAGTASAPIKGPYSGGIGLVAWDPSPGVAQLILKDVNVTTP